MEKKQFKTESKKLLDMMVISMYPHKEIFLRELISNASDAIDKLYYRSLTYDTVKLVHDDYEIRLTADKAARTLTVADNGCGMSAEDAPVAFRRHATSKLRTEEDLNALGTLGFRGEALASIAAVSRVEMVTKQRDQPLGARICLEGGEQTVYEEAGCADGTTIVERDLFYNVPARLKFLKRDTAEAAQIGGIMDRIALSHPEISFKYIVDRKQRMHPPGDGKLLSAVYAVFGR